MVVSRHVAHAVATSPRASPQCGSAPVLLRGEGGQLHARSVLQWGRAREAHTVADNDTVLQVQMTGILLKRCSSA